MSDLLCSARCRIPGRHRDGCQDEACRGCLPGRAADGLNLCAHHLERLGTDPVSTAQLYDELAYSVMPSGGASNQPIGRSSDGPPVPRDKVVEIRTEIRHVLASWCRLVGEERGLHLPADEVSAMGAYVAKHATWLAAHSAAGEVADELDSLRRRAWSIAYPNGTTRRELHKDCPIDGCAGKLLALMRPMDAVLPPEVFCSADEPHRWMSSEWRQLDRLVARRAA